MTKDDILQALRLTAMGRCNHPQQEELAEKLAALFAPVAATPSAETQAWAASLATIADADPDALRAKRRKKVE